MKHNISIPWQHTVNFSMYNKHLRKKDKQKNPNYKQNKLSYLFSGTPAKDQVFIITSL